jgi:hypothetical protein
MLVYIHIPSVYHDAISHDPKRSKMMRASQALLDRLSHHGEHKGGRSRRGGG